MLDNAVADELAVIEDSRLVEHFIRVGIAATHLARVSVNVRNMEFTLKWGRLSIGDYSAGTQGIEPTAADWERLVLILTENGVQDATR